MPAVSDPFAAQRAKSAARVLKYLREVERAGDRPDAAELDALEQYLGARPVDLDAGRRALELAVVAGRYDAVDLLPYAWTRVQWEQRLRTGAMGVLIDPDGAVSRLPEAHRQEVWRIYETAEQHLVAVISNNPDGNTDESH